MCHIKPCKPSPTSRYSRGPSRRRFRPRSGRMKMQKCKGHWSKTKACACESQLEGPPPPPVVWASLERNDKLIRCSSKPKSRLSAAEFDAKTPGQPKSRMARPVNLTRHYFQTNAFDRAKIAQHAAWAQGEPMVFRMPSKNILHDCQAREEHASVQKMFGCARVNAASSTIDWFARVPMGKKNLTTMLQSTKSSSLEPWGPSPKPEPSLSPKSW